LSPEASWVNFNLTSSSLSAIGFPRDFDEQSYSGYIAHEQFRLVGERARVEEVAGMGFHLGKRHPGFLLIGRVP
jgi:hypothetical protein